MSLNRKGDSAVDVREILSIIWRRKWLLMLPVPLVAAMTFAGSYLITPQFDSQTIIQIDPQIQLIGDIQRLIGEETRVSAMRGNDRANMLRSMYNEITSTQYAELLNDRMRLVDNPEIEQQAQLYVQMQPNMTIERARITALQDRLKETVDMGWASGDQIRISVTSTDARQARDIANNLGEIFIDERIRQDLVQIRSSQDFSDIQLEKYERRLNDKIQEMTRVEQQLTNVRAQEATATAQTNRVEITTEIDQTETEIKDLREEEQDVVRSLGDVEGLNTGNLTLDDSERKSDAEGELEDRLGQIGNLLARYTWSDPQVLNFRVRQNDLLKTIESENRRLVAEQYSAQSQDTQRLLANLFNIRSNLNYLYAKKPYLESALSDLTPSSSLIPELEARVGQLQREVEVARDIRDRFRRQQESSTISQALLQERSTSKYRQVEPAKLALEPFTPNRKKIVLM